jgi:hypothetical protein
MTEGVRRDAQGSEAQVHYCAPNPNLVLLQEHASEQKLIRSFTGEHHSKDTCNPASLGLLKTHEDAIV